ncbi:hypothetical protein TNCV_1000171, partial [Trichonephila clavipes]
ACVEACRHLLPEDGDRFNNCVRIYSQIGSAPSKTIIKQGVDSSNGPKRDCRCS